MIVVAVAEHHGVKTCDLLLEPKRLNVAPDAGARPRVKEHLAAVGFKKEREAVLRGDVGAACSLVLDENNRPDAQR